MGDTEERERIEKNKYIKLCEDVGLGYINLLRILASDSSSESKLQEIQQVLIQFPPELKRIIYKATEAALLSIKQNKETIRKLIEYSHLSNNTESKKKIHVYMLTILVQGKYDPEMYEVLEQDSVLTSVLADFFLLTLGPTATDYLRERNIYPTTHGQYIEQETTEGKIRYTVAASSSESGNEDRDATRMHEYHHMIFSALEEREMTRKSKEEGGRVQQFREFRDELTAYVVDASIRRIYVIDTLTIDHLIYTYNDTDLALRRTVYEFIYAFQKTMNIARDAGTSPSIFIYPILSSRSFDDALGKIQQIEDQLETHSTKKNKKEPPGRILGKKFSKLFTR